MEEGNCSCAKSFFFKLLLLLLFFIISIGEEHSALTLWVQINNAKCANLRYLSFKVLFILYSFITRIQDFGGQSGIKKRKYCGK